MTIDQRLEALTHNLELLSIETEKHDKQIARLSILVTEVAEGTARLLQVATNDRGRMTNDERPRTND